MGIVSAPAKGELFKGVLGVGAYKADNGVQAEIKTKILNLLNILLSARIVPCEFCKSFFD